MKRISSVVTAGSLFKTKPQLSPLGQASRPTFSGRMLARSPQVRMEASTQRWNDRRDHQSYGTNLQGQKSRTRVSCWFDLVELIGIETTTSSMPYPKLGVSITIAPPIPRDPPVSSVRLPFNSFGSFMKEIIGNLRC